MTDDFILVRIKKRIVHLVSWIIRAGAADIHESARRNKDPEQAKALRQDADEVTQVANDMEKEIRK